MSVRASGFLHSVLLLIFVSGQVSAGDLVADTHVNKFKNSSVPAIAVPGAIEHNIIRDALSQQKTLNNLGYFLDQSYDFSQQPAPAQTLPELQDSSAMQASAAQHVQACQFKHIDAPYGQNLFAGTGTSWTLEQAVNSWADEVRYYDFDTGSCAAGEMCGHYTQLVWENSRNVGCVIQQCDRMLDNGGSVMFGGRSGVMIFCHYDPPGNVRSQAPYRKATDVPVSRLAFSMKVMLQGAYDPANGMMRGSLSDDLLVTNEPYSALGHTVSGARVLNHSLGNNTGADALVDWVLVELRRSENPAQVVDSMAAVVQRDGDLVRPDTGSTALIFEGQPAGDYYLSVRHRNHLGVMTRQSLALSNSPVTVDFSSPATSVWGQHARFEVSGKALLWAGDVNYDGRVISVGVGNDSGSMLRVVLLDEENSSLSANYIVREYDAADVNLDGKVIYAGVGNDVNYITSNVLLHPANTSSNANFIVIQQLP